MTEITKIEVDWHHGWMNHPTLEVHVDKRPDHDDFEYMALKTNARVNSLSSEQLVAVNAGIPLPVGALPTTSPLVLNVTNADNDVTKGTAEDWRDVGKIFLLSTNLNPWIKYVSIDDPFGSPTRHGNCGGEFKMIDGSTFKSRTGWSSSDSDVNSVFKQFVPNFSDIVDVTLVEPRELKRGPHYYPYPMRWAGYSLTLDALKQLRVDAADIWPTENGKPVYMVKVGHKWVPSVDYIEMIKPPAPPK